MSGRLFYATADDLRPGLKRFEEAVAVRYYEMGIFDFPAPLRFDAGAELPGLGLAPSGDANHEPFYLVMYRSASIEPREIPQNSGGAKFAIDQLQNPDSTVFRPCGMYEVGVMIAGRISTMGLTPTAIELQRLMVRTVTKGFRRVRACWLGPQALEMFEKGARLTAALQMPREFDLKRE
jgi:hypothetical protein